MQAASDQPVAIILIHSSKAMRAASGHGRSLTTPALRDQTYKLAEYLKTLSVEQLTKVDLPYANLYDFWGDSIARCLPPAGVIVNLAAVEYSRTVTRFLDPGRLVSPRFLTVHPQTGEPTFVAVHAKIARGAFARWLLTARVDTPEKITEFAEIGYRHAPSLSKPRQPAFVCKEFGGKGLSVRLHG